MGPDRAVPRSGAPPSHMSATMPAAKRQKSGSNWTLTFDTPVLLSCVTHAVGNLSQTIHIAVAGSKMSTQAVSSSKSCIVAAELDCEVTRGGSGDVEFAVDARTLLLALKGIQDVHGAVISEPEAASDYIVVEAHDPAANTTDMRWKIPKVSDDVFRVTLDTLNYECEWMYDLQTLRFDLKRCREMDCEDIVKLGYYRGSDASSSMVEISSAGARGEVTIRHAASGEERTEDKDPPSMLFEQRYCVENLSDFLRTIDQTRVKLFLGPDQPMVVEVPLGSDDGKMSFVQGPHATE